MLSRIGAGRVEGFPALPLGFAFPPDDGFVSIERSALREAPAQVATDLVTDSRPRLSFSRTRRLLLTMLLLGAGFQVHVFVNGAPLDKGLVNSALLP